MAEASDVLGGKGVATSEPVHSVLAYNTSADGTVEASLPEISNQLRTRDLQMALSMIASSAVTLNTDHLARVTARRLLLRSSLFDLASNAVLNARVINSSDIVQRAVALELIVAQPDEVLFPESAVQLVGKVVNTSSPADLADAAITSTVKTLSSCIEASMLYGSSAEFYTSIDTALLYVHERLVEFVVPGEDAFTTQAPWLALSTSKAICTSKFADGGCLDKTITSPPLSETSYKSSFMLRSETMSEIRELFDDTALDFCSEPSGSFGLRAVTWGANPGSSAITARKTHGIELSMAANMTSADLVLTRCGRARHITNLSFPIEVVLALTNLRTTAKNHHPLPEVIDGHCSKTGVVVVRCNSTGTVHNISCLEAGWEWSVNCPSFFAAPECYYYDTAREQWGTEGVLIVNATSDAVLCQTQHLTKFAAALGVRFQPFAATLNTASVATENLRHSWDVLFLLLLVYAFSIYVLLLDRRRLSNHSIKRRADIFDSPAYQQAVGWLHRAYPINPRVVDAESHDGPEVDEPRMFKLQQQHPSAQAPIRRLLAGDAAYTSFVHALKMNHPLCVLMSPSHATNERGIIVLTRLVCFLFSDALACSIFKEQFNAIAGASAFGKLVFFALLGVFHNTLLMLLIEPSKSAVMAVARVRAITLWIRVMIERKLAVTGLARIFDPRMVESTLDIRAAMLSASSFIDVARAKQRSGAFLMSRTMPSRMRSSEGGAKDEINVIIDEARHYVHALKTCLDARLAAKRVSIRLMATFFVFCGYDRHIDMNRYCSHSMYLCVSSTSVFVSLLASDFFRFPLTALVVAVG